MLDSTLCSVLVFDLLSGLWLMKDRRASKDFSKEPDAFLSHYLAIAVGSRSAVLLRECAFQM